MAQEAPTFDYHEESQSEKLARKSKESPFMVIGKVFLQFIYYTLNIVSTNKRFNDFQLFNIVNHSTYRNSTLPCLQ